jgi:hypothetical protein
MLSNALSPACLLADLRGSFELVTTLPAEPEPGEILGLHPVVLVLLMIGLCVLAVAIGLWAMRPSRLSLRDAPQRDNRLNILQVAGALVVFWGASRLASLLLGQVFLKGIAEAAVAKPLQARYGIGAGAVGSLFWLIASLLVAALAFREGLWRGLGLGPVRPLGQALRALVGYLMVFPICTGLHVAATMLFTALHWPITLHPVLRYFATFPPGWKAAAVVSALVLAPLAEEVFFRGLVQSLIRRFGISAWLAILGGSLLFAVVHHNQPQAIPSLFALSIVLGYSYERTGRLLAPILLHAVFNAVQVGLVVLA